MKVLVFYSHEENLYSSTFLKRFIIATSINVPLLHFEYPRSQDKNFIQIYQFYNCSITMEKRPCECLSLALGASTRYFVKSILDIV